MTLALLLLSTLCGLMVAAYSPPLPLLGPVLLAGSWLLLRKAGLAAVALALFCAGLAAYHYRLQLHPPLPAHHVARLPQDRPLTIEGRVQAIDAAGETLRIDLDAERLVEGAASRALAGRLRLTIGEGDPGLQIGQRIRFRSRLRPPAPFGTPGEFDYRRYLAARDIRVTAYLSQAEAVVAFATEKHRSFFVQLAAQRHRIGQRIDLAVPPDQAPLVRALVIGDRRFSTARRQLLAETGLSHLFAISGLHLGLVALLLYSAGRFLYRRSESLLLLAPPGRLLPVVLLPLLWLYLLLAGNALSTRRAFLMAGCGALLLLYRYRTGMLQGLAAVALVMLCVAPLTFFEPAWQLSMAGIGGILLLMPRWQQPIAALPKLWRWPVGLAATTLAATIATTPLVIAHFHLLAPASLLTNLIAVPLIGFGAVPLGLAGVLVAPLWPEGATLLYRLCGTICQLTLQGAAQLADWPPLAARTLYLSPLALTASGILALLLLLPAPVGRWRHMRWPLAAAAMLLLLLPGRTPQALTVTALSVGQGEALLLSRPGDGHYLIDGGGLYGGTFDVGARLVAPALARLGVDSLQAVVLTHDHPDHRQGLAQVLDDFPVASFWTTRPLAEQHPDIRAPLRRHAIALRTFAPGWTPLDENPERPLAVYVPPPQLAKCNDRSLVLYAGYHRDGVLLTGDLEQQGVSALLADSPDGPVTLLKLPHHGSRYSEPWRLVERFRPQQVFACSGRGNTYDLPHQEVAEFLAQWGLPLSDTGRDHTLRFTSDGDGWQLQRWRKGLFR